MKSFQLLIGLSVLVQACIASYSCDCTSCIGSVESQCDIVGGTYSTSGTSASCSDISCIYYTSIPCSTICIEGATCGSSSTNEGNCNANDDASANYGKCSDKVYANCVQNIGDKDGDWARCNMCMCDEYESYGGSGSCGADDELYNCFLSTDGCKSQLRQAWIIGFSFIAFSICLCCCAGCFFLFKSKGKGTAPA